MEARNNEKGDFFQEFGLEVINGEIEIGKVYPLFAMITKFIDDTPGQVRVELNFHIQAQLTVDDPERVQLLKERMFESGIFVSKVVTKDPSIEVACQTVIFGKKQSFNA